MTDAPAPMDEETLPPEEEEDETCMYSSRFDNAHGYSATGTTASTLLKICRKANPDVVPKGDPPRRAKSQLAKFEKLLDSEDGAKLKAELLRYRRRAIKKWNKERRAEEKAAAGVVDDGPLSYPEFGSCLHVVAGALRERDDLAAEARSRFGEELYAQALGQRLLASDAQEDKELIGKLVAHRNARSNAWRKKLSGGDGRKGRDGRTLGSAVAQTAALDASSRADWSGAPGKKGTEALEEALDPLDETPPLSDTATWDTIAATVSVAAGRDYTGTQCYCRASGQGYLHAKLPDVQVYDPTMGNWAPRNVSSLVAAVDREHFTREAIEALSTPELYERAADVYNLGLRPLHSSRDREALIKLLLEAGMCAVDPCKNGVPDFERATSARFRRALNVEMLPRCAVLASLEASEARLESPSDGDNLVRTEAAVYGRLSQQNLMCLCIKEFGLASYETPPKYMAPLLNEYFFRPPYQPHVEYDAAQDCTCCHGLYEDNGFATCLEHAHDVRLGCCAIRNNGACEFAASPSFERRLRRRRLHASSVAWSVLLFNFHTGNKCNISWIDFFDKLAREFKIETLREKRAVAVAANKRWGHLNPRRSAWKYD